MNATEDRLQPLIVFLRSTGDVHFSRFFSRVRSDLSTAGSNRERRAAAQRGLAAFAGMNSFNDLVIMEGNHAAPELNNQLDRLREDAYSFLNQIRLDTLLLKEQP